MILLREESWRREGLLPARYNVYSTFPSDLTTELFSARQPGTS
jgi:hypothetical protein